MSNLVGSFVGDPVSIYSRLHESPNKYLFDDFLTRALLPVFLYVNEEGLEKKACADGSYDGFGEALPSLIVVAPDHDEVCRHVKKTEESRPEHYQSDRMLVLAARLYCTVLLD